jgi:NTE family protein
MTRARALVLGGGGATGVAWEISVLAGLAEAGVDVTDADTLIGTSAGSVVAAGLALGESLEQLFDEQVGPVLVELRSRMGPVTMLRLFAHTLLPGTVERQRARLGRAAERLSGRDVERMEEALAALGIPEEWPDRRLLITAVDVRSGRLTAFDSASGVPLSTAVAASCAVPLLFPPVRIDGRAYMDGGIPSPTNADLARGAEVVLVVAPIVQAMRRSARVHKQLTRLGPSVAHHVLSPDRAASAAIGRDLMDPHRAASAARAGRAQGTAAADEVKALWAGG